MSTAMISSTGRSTMVPPAGLQLWQENFPAIGSQGAASLGAVPEPSAALLAVAGLIALFGLRRTRI